MGNTCGGGGGASAVGDGDLQLEREALRLRDGDRWYLADLPAGPVVRREIRRMSPAEQERFANAVDKMMEAEDGVPGSSQFFRLACYHGGPQNALFNVAGEHCVHGYEAFPGWHRAYLLEFEGAFRRADMALGGDGMIGLPYWGWDDVAVNGEVFPKVVRERFSQYPPDMFPRSDADAAAAGAAETQSDRGLRVPPDGSIARWIGSVGDEARRSLRVAQHWQHACTRGRSATKPSIESPHNTVHGKLGGVMASFQSSFHPIFWLHHNNIDRFYEQYISMHPDSLAEFKQMQEKLTIRGRVDRQRGYPEGSWGVYYGGGGAFENPSTGGAFHASDSFDIARLGYGFDALPKPPPAAASDQQVLRNASPFFLSVFLQNMNTDGLNPRQARDKGKEIQLHRTVSRHRRCRSLPFSRRFKSQRWSTRGISTSLCSANSSSSSSSSRGKAAAMTSRQR